MQFSSQMMRSSALKRNSHFDTCFASWSETRKLVLGLADGNFACWDLQSNETFISRKHFAGKHKGAITCGAWGMKGQVLALGSKNQLKLSAPLLNASWEATAAKLALPDNELSFQELSFSPSGQTLSALAGTSIFRHLCLYSVTTETVKNGKKMEERQTLSPVGEMRPDATIGGIQVCVCEGEQAAAAAAAARRAARTHICTPTPHPPTPPHTGRRLARQRDGRLCHLERLFTPIAIFKGRGDPSRGPAQARKVSSGSSGREQHTAHGASHTSSPPHPTHPHTSSPPATASPPRAFSNARATSPSSTRAWSPSSTPYF